jgi:hypothetical protein
MMSANLIAGAVLKRWAAVKIGSQIHLVGVLLGGHPRLAPGRWIITSAVVAFDRTVQVAVTASSGRSYHLLDRLEPPLPLEVADLLADVFDAWRLPVDTTIEFAEL